jgi:PIN like domain
VTTVFFDRTSGKKIPQALKLLGLDVEGHADHFAHDIHDDIWLAAVGDRHWVVITNDKRLRFNEAERQALIAHGVGCFTLGGGSRSRWDRVRILARAWDRIRQAIESTPRPFIFTIHVDGHLEQMYPPAQRSRRMRRGPSNQ